MTSNITLRISRLDMDISSSDAAARFQLDGCLDSEMLWGRDLLAYWLERFASKATRQAVRSSPRPGFQR